MTTKRKWRPLEPDEIERDELCFDYGLPDGGQVVVRGDGRAFARKMLADVLPSWDRIWCYGTADGTQAVIRGVFPHEREIVNRFNLPALKRELSAEHFELVRALYDALKEQSLVASYAVGVARVELGAAAKRAAGGKKAASASKRAAAVGDANLKGAAEKLKARNRSLSDSSIAEILSERGFGGTEAIRKKLPRLLGD